MSSSNANNYRLFDYFAIVGLDADANLEPNRLQGGGVIHPPLERSYKASILGAYPDHVPDSAAFDSQSILMLCLPKGLQFMTQKSVLEPQFHPYLVTREDGSRSHGFAFVFYEEVNAKQICTSLHTLQSVYLTEMSSIQAKANAGTTTGDRHASHSLPRQFRLSSPKSSGAKYFYDITKDQLFVTKCITLVGQHPYVTVARKFLPGLYRIFTQCESESMNLEAHVYNLLYEVPSPPPGKCVSFSCIGSNFLCQRPTPHELPLFEYPLKELFSILSVEDAIQLFSCVLLENQVLLLSEDYYKLMLVAESICVLLFPFVWQHVYVPILPSSLHHFLDAPVPFIMGLHCTPLNRDSVSVPNEANLCLVDIDNSTVEVPEDLPQFPNKKEFVKEIMEVLAKYNISLSSAKLDRNLNERCSSQYKYRRRRKFSLSHDSDSGVSSNEGSISGSNSSIPSLHPFNHFGSHQSSFISRPNSLTENLEELRLSSSRLREIAAVSRKAAYGGTEYDKGHPRDYRTNLDIFLAQREVISDTSHNADISAIIDDLKINNAIREVFLNRFVHMLCTYDHFIIQPDCHKMLLEQWLSCRDPMHNFDKTTFLSDQPEAHLPFLSHFIESQMFTTFIDNKILSFWGENEPNLRIFDIRIKVLRKRYADTLLRTPPYEPCATADETEQVLLKRLSHVDFAAPLPQPIDPKFESCTVFNPTHFPLLDRIVLNREPQKNKKRSSHAWRRKERQAQHLEHTTLTSDQREKALQDAKTKVANQPKLSELSTADIAQANWRFVEQLLKECKTRTKRMLVDKMGSEAIELGHGEGSIVGVEENTLIASLCDLLERVWAHGLQKKQGKSALWSHLSNYLEIENCADTAHPVNPNLLSPVKALSSTSTGSLSPLAGLINNLKTGNLSGLSTVAFQIANNFDLSSLAFETESAPSSPTHSLNSNYRKKASSRALSDKGVVGDCRKLCDPANPTLHPLLVSVVQDMKSVIGMTEIKSHIGYARAWVRLSLEKKVLSKHLTALLSNNELLNTLYKRYAFLRCDDEKEQFLSYLLSLNAVDYFCFTNTYTSSILLYRVVIFSSRKSNASSTTANAWVSLGGSLGQTSKIALPRNQAEVLFQHKNLGLLTTLRIGHDNGGISPKWLIEHVLVRNEITGHTWKFPCGRWLGRGIDDGSLERILVGELVPFTMTSSDLVESCRTPPRCRSPNVPGPKKSDVKLSAGDIQQLLGDAINSIVKYFYKPEKDRGSLTLLLCGDLGLVYCMELVFLYGFKSTRFFGRNLYIWDYFDRLQQHFEEVLREEYEREQLTGIARDGGDHGLPVMAEFIRLVLKINTSSSQLGKDDKFQLFICIAARDRLLHRLLFPLQRSPITSHMYEDCAFLRDPQLIRDLINVLSTLAEFKIVLEGSLTRGIDN